MPLVFVPKYAKDKKSSLVKGMVWRRIGAKPLVETMKSFAMHKYVT